jgi:hypothetical protein
MAKVLSLIAHRKCSQCGQPAAYIKRVFRWWWFPKDTWLCIDCAFADDDHLIQEDANG